MRNIATCYSEHAIKVSDSYCSGPSNHHPPYRSPNSTTTTTTPSIQNQVTSVYRLKPTSQNRFLIMLSWWDKGFTIASSNDDDNPPSNFITNSLKLTRTEGAKSFQCLNSTIKLTWDLSKAKYEAGPEPVTGFNLAVWVDSELCLSLGDPEEEEEEEEPKLRKFSLISRCEKFLGNCCLYKTKARFSESGSCHEITIKWDSVLWVSVDGKIVIQVKRLKWNFRGNYTMFVDGLLVDMMWDVHDWLFDKKPRSGCGGVFMFRTRSGFDSRLWLEEEKRVEREEDRSGFSLLICASKDPD